MAINNIATHHRADIFWRSRVDDVPGEKLEGLRESTDLFGDIPDHLVEVGILTDGAVYL